MLPFRSSNFHFDRRRKKGGWLDELNERGSFRNRKKKNCRTFFAGMPMLLLFLNTKNVSVLPKRGFF